MSGSEPPHLEDPDDWFGDPDRPDGDWLDVEPATATRDEWSAGGFTVKLRTLLVVAAIVVVLVLVAGLAVAGVFSRGKPRATPPTTSQTTTTTPTTPTTPAATNTVLPAPATTLKPGDQGAQVKRLQRALARLGYKVGAVDGDYGPATQAALTSFQKDSKLTEDGVLGLKTLQALKQALRQHG